MNNSDPSPPEQRPPNERMHPAVKVLLIILLGIPAALLVLGALVLGVCMLG